MEINLLDTLREHYCASLHVFNYPGGMGQLGSPEWRNKRDELNRTLISDATRLRASGRLDLIFCVVYDDFLLVETAKQLQALGAPMVNYHVDMAFQWYRVIRTAPYFDVMAVAQSTNAMHLQRYNPNIEWIPMAANPQFYHARAMKVSSYQYTASFVGSCDPYRRGHVATCLRTGVLPTVFGRGWELAFPAPYQFPWDAYKIAHDLRYYALPRWRAEGLESFTGPLKRKLSRRLPLQRLDGPEFRPPCSDETLPEIFRSSQINLGFSDIGWDQGNPPLTSKIRQCRLRDFEVPMSGGFYLVQQAPDHEVHYEIGKEIETWSEPDELADKVVYYSKNKQAAERIREAGLKRALVSHTWQHRFNQLFNRLRTMKCLS